MTRSIVVEDGALSKQPEPPLITPNFCFNKLTFYRAKVWLTSVKTNDTYCHRGIRVY